MIYAIGDIHGEDDALRQMLSKLPLEPSDTVIFLGDAINRGPHGYECVEQILTFDRCRKVFIPGNHEEAMLIYLEDGDPIALTGMAGQGTLDSYAAAGIDLRPGGMAALPEAHQRFYGMAYPWTLPFYITEQYIFTHAGWDLALPLERQSASLLRWSKVKGCENSVWTQTVIRGHTPMPKITPVKSKQYISIDTGCGMGGFLSALALPSGEHYSARPSSFVPRWYARR